MIKNYTFFSNTFLINRPWGWSATWKVSDICRSMTWTERGSVALLRNLLWSILSTGYHRVWSNYSGASRSDKHARQTSHQGKRPTAVELHCLADRCENARFHTWLFDHFLHYRLQVSICQLKPPFGHHNLSTIWVLFHRLPKIILNKNYFRRNVQFVLIVLWH